MIEFIQSITNNEIQFISELDYQKDSKKHLEALNQVIFNQNGILQLEQYWFPYEVIELGANALQKSHDL